MDIWERQLECLLNYVKMSSQISRRAKSSGMYAFPVRLQAYLSLCRPWITAGMRSGIEERLFLLQESWENLHAPSTGQKRAHSSSSNGSPAKKQKTSAWSSTLR